MSSKLDTFFVRHPVFTIAELDEFLSRERDVNPGTRQALLSHHQRQGHVRRVRRRLYASVPAGADPSTLPVDPFLLASRLSEDAVIGYHAALAFHGRAYSVRTEYTAISEQTHVVPFHFQGHSFRAVYPAAALVRSGETNFGVEMADRSGLSLRVTNLERTLVDALDRPDLAGGWEEIWRSFDDVASLDVDQVVTYALLLDNAVVAAKVGYFLELHAEVLGVSIEQLERLKQHRPRQPRYMAGDRRHARFVSEWNLMVPEVLFGLTWQEVA
jgi:predicted transcriptional regulator of viral defense system